MGTGTQTVATLVAVAVGLMFGGVLITGIASANEEGVKPQKQEALEQLGELGPTTVHLGEEGSASAQFRSLVVFNMMSAADCNLMKNLIVAVQKGNNASEVGWGDNKAPPHFNGTYPGLEPLAENTEYEPKCQGQSSILFEIEETVEESFKDQIPLAGYERGLLDQPGNDMEGVHSTKKFVIDETFSIDGDNRLLAYKQHFKKGSGKVPEFLETKYVSVFIPSGISGSEFESVPGDSGEYQKSDEENDGLEPLDWYRDDDQEYNIGSGYRVATNAPILVENSYNLGATRIQGRADTKTIGVSGGKMENKTEVFGGDGKVSLHNLMENSRYLYCEGAKGFVKTNAGSYNDDGEAGGDPPKEDRVYPFVRLTESRESCFDFPQAENNVEVWKTYVRDAETHEKKFCRGSDVMNRRKKEVQMGAESSFDAECEYLEHEVKFEAVDGSDVVYLPVMTFSGDRCGEKTYDIMGHYRKPVKKNGGATVNGGENIEVTLTDQNSASAKFNYSLLKYEESSDIRFSIDRFSSPDKKYTVDIRFFDSRGNRIYESGNRPLVKLSDTNVDEGNRNSKMFWEPTQNGFKKSDLFRTSEDGVSEIVIERGDSSAVRFFDDSGSLVNDGEEVSVSISKGLTEATNVVIEISKNNKGTTGEPAVIQSVEVEGKPRGCGS